MNLARFVEILKSEDQLRGAFVIYCNFYVRNIVGLEILEPKLVNNELDFANVLELLKNIANSQNAKFGNLLEQYTEKIQKKNAFIEQVIANSFPLPILEEFPSIQGINTEFPE